ncbi:MAG: hypothetical protein IJS39_02970 [Synergistaceae bacterium]|nr:hypothetical protein [Synergistaceae bacterium]
MSQGMILTAQGRNLIAKALTGKELCFTRAMVGDGALRSGQDPASLSALISPKKELPIQSMNVLTSVGTAEVVLEMSNKNLTQGFFVREYGLFARDPDTHNEVLYSYCNKGSEAGYLEGDNGTDQINYVLSLVTVVDQAPNVTAYITSSNQYVTISRMEQRVLDLYAPYANPSGFWSFTESDTERIRPSTLEQTRKALLGDADVTGLNSRLERVEDALNQTMLALEMLQVFPGYSHYMAEDFKDTSMLDAFESDVLSVVAGDDSIDCSPIDGMLPGSLYTVSDGINSEVVQVESINLENGIQRIILKDRIQNTYILAHTRLYRTNSNIESESASGAAARLKISWEPALEWRGTGEQQDFSVTVNTALSNSKAYDFTGDISLGSSGEVSLSA